MDNIAILQQLREEYAVKLAAIDAAIHIMQRTVAQYAPGAYQTPPQTPQTVQTQAQWAHVDIPWTGSTTPPQTGQQATQQTPPQTQQAAPPKQQGGGIRTDK